MENSMKFDYYYGIQAEQFSFYRIPRLLIKDPKFKDLSSDAKLLYGLMLDRLSLSMKNGWVDEQNRVYVYYTLVEIMEDLGCAKEKCAKILAELDSKKGIGLIRKKRQGLGRPDMIYVMNFAVENDRLSQKRDVRDTETNCVYSGKTESIGIGCDEYVQDDENQDVQDVIRAGIGNRTSRSSEIELQESGKSNFKKFENRTSGVSEIELQEVRKSNFKSFGNQTSRVSEIELPEVRKSNPNYTDNNYTDLSHNQSIQSDHENDGQMDSVRASEIYMQIIRDNIEYDHFMQSAGYHEAELVEEIYQLICDVVCVPRDYLQINGTNYPYELVKSKFLKIRQDHVIYILERLKKNTAKVGNIKSYLLTTLYNAPLTMNHYYQQEVQHDMYGGGTSNEKIFV